MFDFIPCPVGRANPEHDLKRLLYHCSIVVNAPDSKSGMKRVRLLSVVPTRVGASDNTAASKAEIRGLNPLRGAYKE